jgi:Tol biopolymer transport system component
MRYAQLPFIIAIAAMLAVALPGATKAPQAEAAFPGTNGKIAFYTTRNIDDTDLYLMDSSGANQTLIDTPPISTSLSSGNAPDWSPDGQHLAFTVNSAGQTQVFVGDFNGSTLVNIRNVSGTSASAGHIGWRPVFGVDCW